MELHFSVESIAILIAVAALISIPVAYFGGYLEFEMPPIQAEPTGESALEPTPAPSAESTPVIESSESQGLAGILVDKEFIYISMTREETEKRLITITNPGNKIIVKVKINWQHSDALLSSKMDNIVIEGNSSESFEIEAVSTENAEGEYTGTIEISEQGTESNEKIVIDVSIEIDSTSAVKKFSDGNLYFSPAIMDLNTGISGDRKEIFETELCNRGNKLIKNIELGVSGVIGEWIKKPEKISGLPANECIKREIEVSIPEKTSFGTYSGLISAVSEDLVASLDLTVRIQGMRDLIEFSWADAEFGNCSKDNCKTIELISLRNSSQKKAVIKQIIVEGWSESDDDNSELKSIELNETKIWDGNISDGNIAEIENIELQEWKLSRMKLGFLGAIKNNGEQFRITLVFSDDSELKSGTWPVFADANSLTLNWDNAEIDLFGLKLSGWTLENKSETDPISIERMRVFNWPYRDRDNSSLKKIFFDSSNAWTGLSKKGEWLDVTNLIIPANSTATKNMLDFTQRIDDDFEQIIVEFYLSNDSVYRSTPWPNYAIAELWETEEDFPQPVDFNHGAKSTANTFGLGNGNDGWDWTEGIYGFDTDCVEFNIDPNKDNSIEDSDVPENKDLRIKIGDYGDDCNVHGEGSAAYGIEFEVSEELFSEIEIARIMFDWKYISHEMDSKDYVWVKARIGNKQGMNFLGVQEDTNGDDATKEIFFGLGPDDANGSVNIRANDYFTEPGTYYLELGAIVGEWEDNDWAEFVFDNVDIVFD